MFGDTDNSRKNRHVRSISFDKDGNIERLAGKEQWIPKQSGSLYPAAGYSIWWDGLDEWPKKDKLSQTVVAWSYFPGHAHKHADEMSVLLWAKGNNWWTNAGYWPYGTKGRSHALSWAGSNSPHLTNESSHSNRHTELISHGWSESLAAIDLLRRGPDEYAARRQVVQVKPNLWIILDSTSGSKDQRTTTTWTAPPEVKVHEGKTPGAFNLSVPNNSTFLATYIIGSDDIRIRTFQGSYDPFAGWVQGIPATSIVIEQPANDSWAAAIWLLQESDKENHRFRDTPFMENWKGPRNWQITLPLASGPMNIGRNDERIFFHTATETGIQEELKLSEPPQISEKLTEIHTAYETAASKYPIKRYSTDRHLKLTYFIFFIFLLQEVFFFIYKRIGWKHLKGLRVLTSVGWVILGIWISTRI